MKFLEVLKAATTKIWHFLTFTIKVGLIGIFVLLALAILMPENAMRVIEIIKGLIP